MHIHGNGPMKQIQNIHIDDAKRICKRLTKNNVFYLSNEEEIHVVSGSIRLSTFISTLYHAKKRTRKYNG